MKNPTILILLLLIAASCKKNGTGGKTDITAFTAHHLKPIYGPTVYVKFNATELPQNPTDNYDLKVTAESNENHVHILSLLPGNYYLFATGYDSSFRKQVRGGIPLKITRKDKDKEVNVDIAVSE